MNISVAYSLQTVAIAYVRYQLLDGWFILQKLLSMLTYVLTVCSNI